MINEQFSCKYLAPGLIVSIQYLIFWAQNKRSVGRQNDLHLQPEKNSDLFQTKIVGRTDQQKDSRPFNCEKSMHLSASMKILSLVNDEILFRFRSRLSEVEICGIHWSFRTHPYLCQRAQAPEAVGKNQHFCCTMQINLIASR